jgi:hypothetical protein
VVDGEESQQARRGRFAWGPRTASRLTAEVALARVRSMAKSTGSSTGLALGSAAPAAGSLGAAAASPLGAAAASPLGAAGASLAAAGAAAGALAVEINAMGLIGGEEGVVRLAESASEFE